MRARERHKPDRPTINARLEMTLDLGLDAYFLETRRTTMRQYACLADGYLLVGSNYGAARHRK
jgi:hypothetical protein